MTSMTSLKGTIPQDRNQVTNSRFEETDGIDQSRESLEESFNNRTIQYTERSNAFHEDVKNMPKPQATEYGKPFLQ